MSEEAAGAEDRYSRQSRFWAIGEAGQERLRAARVVVIGCGALGSTVIDLLARSGVGHLVVVDRDTVELSNLQRQLLFDEADAAAGTPKAVAAAEAVARFNSEVAVQPVVADVTPVNVQQIVAGSSVVVDGTDNLETRYLINDACVRLGIPWVYGGAIGATGMSMTIIPGQTPCFRCLFPDPQPAGTMETCDVVGVLGSTVMQVGAHQWTEVVKLILDARHALAGGLQVLDVWSNTNEIVTGIERRPDCPCCGEGRYEYLDASATSRTVTLCGRNAVQVSPAQPVRLDLAGLRERLSGTAQVTGNDYLLRVLVADREFTIFPDGRAIIKGTFDPAEARSLYARYVGA